jgi:hypothetical protein
LADRPLKNRRAAAVTAAPRGLNAHTSYTQTNPPAQPEAPAFVEAAMSAQAGRCIKCGKDKLVMPLHGEKGGPLTCWACGIEWHAEHNGKRKWGRIVIKAIRAFLKAGGRFSDLDELKLAALGAGLFHFPDWEDTLGSEVGDITTELLEDAIRLTHPDRHPAQRKEAAHRVTESLIVLRPFVFPAPKDKPPALPAPRNGSTASHGWEAVKPLRIEYPCAACNLTIPSCYCDACKAEFEKQWALQRERERAQRQERRKRKRAMRPPVKCAACGVEFKGKRKDAKFCSATCRQAAHRSRVTDKGRAHSALLAAVTEPIYCGASGAT